MISKILQSTFVVSFLLAAAVYTVAGTFLKAHVALNDFWGILYYAKNISWAARESLYNGFYPIGYALLLKAFPFDSVIWFAFLANALFGALFVAAVASFVSTTKSRLGTATAFLAALTYPIVFRSSVTSGADIGAAAFTALGLWLLWKEIISGRAIRLSRLQYICAGIFLGLAPLFRSHAIVSSTAIIAVYYLMFCAGPGRPNAGLIASFLGFSAIQLFVNVASGHGPFETAQKFNIYKLVNDVNFWRPPPVIDQSIAQILLKDPVRSLGVYIPSLASLLVLAWPAAVLYFISHRETNIPRFSLFSCVVLPLYAIPVALGDSSRSALVVSSLFIMPLCMLVGGIVTYVKKIPAIPEWLRSAVIVLLFGGALSYCSRWIQADARFLNKNRLQRETFTHVEQVLLQNGMTTPNEVFTDNFDLYFAGVCPYAPRRNGGWAQYSLWGYDREYPELPIDSATSFFNACSRQGIKFLVLSSKSKEVAHFLGRIYEAHAEGFYRVALISDVNVFRIYRIK